MLLSQNQSERNKKSAFKATFSLAIFNFATVRPRPNIDFLEANYIETTKTRNRVEFWKERLSVLGV